MAKNFKSLLAVVSVIALAGLVSEESFGENYNFYFAKKNKKQEVAEAVDKAIDEDGGDEGESVTERSSKSDSFRSKKGGQPLIINNVNNNENSIHNNVNGGTAVAKRTPKEDKEEPAPKVAASIPNNYPPLHFSITGNAARNSSYADFTYDAPTAMGLALSLGYSSHRWLEWKGFVGAQHEDGMGLTATPYYGLEVEYSPLRIGFAETWDLLRLSVFAGGSTLGTSAGNIASFHVGTRATVQLGSGFGVTAAARANTGYLMFEGGLYAAL